MNLNGVLIPPPGQRDNLKKLAEPFDWPKDFNHENGMYNCECMECGIEFTGHKRRIQCRSCFDKNAKAIISGG